MNENRATESSLPLPDNGRKIQVGDISFVYKNTYHPIYWVGDEPYRPRVETLVIRNGKDVFLRMYDTCEENSLYRYRLPGGSLDNDSTKEQQAENETNEEALLSLSEIHNTGLSYYHYYKDGKLLKGGDICIKYKGTISDIFIGKYKGKVDKSTIEKHDLDNDMATNGKFYPIIKICQLLRPEHIEAIMNSGLVDDNVKGSVRLILRGDKKTKIPEAPVKESTNLSLWGNPVPKNVTLYHASPVQGIKYIEPRQTAAYKDLGPVVFSSRYKSFAACFGTYWDDTTMKQGTDPDDLEKASMWIIDKAYDWSKPCSMYILENDGSFKELVGHPHEYISPNKIKVKKEIKFNSYYAMVKAYDIEVFDYTTKQRLNVTESYIGSDKYYKDVIKNVGISTRKLGEDVGEVRLSRIYLDKDNDYQKFQSYDKPRNPKNIESIIDDDTYVISDLHFAKHGEVRDKKLIDRLNKIPPNATLMILGDLGNRKVACREYLIECFKKIKCKNLYMVLGNHDCYELEYYYDELGFKGVYDRLYLPNKDWFFTHQAGECPSKTAINFHGHIHDEIYYDKVKDTRYKINCWEGYCPVRPKKISEWIIENEVAPKNKYMKSFESATTEMTTTSSIDDNHTKGESMKLSSFKKIKISKSIIDKMKKTIKSLSHIRLDNTEGYIYTDKNNPVAVIVVETKENGEKWIQALEVFGEYKNHGLSKQLLDVAVNELSATELSVNKKNDVAYSLYKKYGFKTKSETDTMYMMTLESNVTEAKDIGANTTGMKRSELPDEMFGIPSERKYELDTEKHVRSAIKLFNWVDPKYEKELATNIIKRMKYFNITDVNVGPKNRFGKYYKGGNKK